MLLRASICSVGQETGASLPCATIQRFSPDRRKAWREPGQSHTRLHPRARKHHRSSAEFEHEWPRRTTPVFRGAALAGHSRHGGVEHFERMLHDRNNASERNDRWTENPQLLPQSELRNARLAPMPLVIHVALCPILLMASASLENPRRVREAQPKSSARRQ